MLPAVSLSRSLLGGKINAVDGAFFGTGVELDGVDLACFEDDAGATAALEARCFSCSSRRSALDIDF